MAKGTYFTKVHGLASVVWDGENDRALIEFDRQGLAMTKRPEVADKLREMGYQEVTAAEITGADMMLPEAFAAMSGREPGQGYTGPATTTPPADAPNITGPAGKGRALVT